MATRRERVVLELDDQFTAQMARAAAAAQLFNRELKGAQAGAPGFTRTAVTIERDSARVGSSIDKLSGRLAIFAQAGAALGPAFSPIATAAVPAIAGLSTSLGFAAVAAGTAVLAFQGVGEALEAMNKAHLEPTAANLAKAQETLARLSPVAQDLVRQLHEMGPALRNVRDAAAEGLLPGVSAALQDVEGLLPRLADIVREVGDVSGELLEAGAEALAGPEWADFFAFVEAEARPTLTTLGQTVGNLTKGLVEMWMAFDPLSDDFTGGLLAASEAFASWAENLAETQGFAEFVRYIQETGPQVLDTLGAIGNMFLQIAIAAAPLGGPILRVLELFAEAIAGIAESDIGTPLFGAVAALSALNLAMTTGTRLSGTMFGKLVTGATTAEAQVGRLTTRMQNLNRQSLTTFGKSAALIGAVGIASTGAADGIGLTNTTSLALAGTLAGPWGAAVGAATGLALDFQAASSGMASSSREVEEALARVTGARSGETSAASDVAALNTELDRLKGKQDDLRGFSLGIFGSGPTYDEVTRKIEAIEDALDGAATSGNNFTGLLNRDLELTDSQFALTTASAEAFRLAMADINAELGDASTLLAYEQALDALEESFKKTRSFNPAGSDEAQANFQNAITLTDRAISRMEALRTKGEDIQAMKVFDRAIADLESFSSKSESAERRLRPLIKALREAAGTDVEPKVDVDTRKATTDLQRWERRFFGLDGKSVTVGINMVANKPVVPSLERDFATGGYTGLGPKYEPRGIVHAGELVIPAEETARDWNMLKSRYGYLPGFADGGYVARSVPASAGVNLSGLAAELAPLVAGLRPVFGDIYESAHDYGEFKRQRQADMLAAGGGGTGWQ